MPAQEHGRDLAPFVNKKALFRKFAEKGLFNL
jgi:hypothetical protein